jgi:hypothetical protein
MGRVGMCVAVHVSSRPSGDLVATEAFARPRLTGGLAWRTGDWSAVGAQEPVDGMAADPAAVFDSILDGVPEVEADEDP